ncbi:coiled-coil domain-containing protein 24 [Anabas testudineus]|uniref:Coiled-coil domain containing 24 n=1 Tax=Anabas testudineus TaxID=64144 RepID=A0A7N6BIA8_ANATE|nr:coiled-coil domain-containing protein 24 [Anabas testudineus]
MQSPDGNQLGCPGPSLWKLITEHVHGSELPKIRTALGHSLVDMYIEVHSEAEMCHKMWCESQPGGNYGSKAGTTLPCQQGSPLPDPPTVKELVRAEVKMLLQTLRERASRGGRDGEELLLRYNPETVNYALGYHSFYTTCTNLGKIDNGSKTENQTRPSSQCSVQSNTEDEIEAVRDKLNVTDIDQVVDRLKSVMLEECEVLKRLVQHLKEGINQKYRQKGLHKSEPTLVELKELRGAVQMDLELYSSSLAASSSALSLHPVKELKNKFRLSTGRKASDETLQALKAASILRPHPPTPLCHNNPRPPVGPPLTKMSASVRPFQTMTHGQLRSISAINKSSKMPICNNITTCEQANSHTTTDQIVVRDEHCCSSSFEEDSAGLHLRKPTSSPRFPIKAQRNSPVHEAKLSSSHSLQSLSKEWELSPHGERKASVQRPGNISPPHEPSLPVLCDATSYSNNSTKPSVTTTGKLNAPNGQQKSTCGGSLLSTAVQTDKDRIKIASECFYSLVLSDTGSTTSHNYSKKNNSGIDSGHPGEHINQQHSVKDCCSSHHSENSGEHGRIKCSRPVSAQINGQFSTFPKRPLGGITQSERVQEEIISNFYQLVPPARVLT